MQSVKILVPYYVNRDRKLVVTKKKNNYKNIRMFMNLMMILPSSAFDYSFTKLSISFLTLTIARETSFSISSITFTSICFQNFIINYFAFEFSRRSIYLTNYLVTRGISKDIHNFLCCLVNSFF